MRLNVREGDGIRIILELNCFQQGHYDAPYYRTTDMVEREHIGFFGKMNAGKSSLMNLLTQQETSIVDPTAGTTADTKITLQEIHGIGPVKLFDTAGFDETNALGEKKKLKVMANLKECDLILLVINPESLEFETERELLDEARELDKQIIPVFNVFSEQGKECIANLFDEIPLLKFYPCLTISANLDRDRSKLIEFILQNFDPKNKPLPLLPNLEKDGVYILNIPMDEETPPGRFLRPQAMCMEYITRHWAMPIAYRMDLGKARAGDIEEKKRFETFLSQFGTRPKMIITDSQAMDIMSQWTPDDIELTTFSIMMIHYGSRGRVNEFYNGVKAMETIAPGDKILIAEACNHSRIGEDIGLVQIPRAIEKRFPGVVVEHAFGREFQEKEDLNSYKLVIHCGGCMITAQKLGSRIRDLRAVEVPYTNYGVFLSWMQGQKMLDRVVKPFI